MSTNSCKEDVFYTKELQDGEGYGRKQQLEGAAMLHGGGRLCQQTVARKGCKFGKVILANSCEKELQVGEGYVSKQLRENPASLGASRLSAQLMPFKLIMS